MCVTCSGLHCNFLLVAEVKRVYLRSGTGFERLPMSVANTVRFGQEEIRNENATIKIGSGHSLVVFLFLTSRFVQNRVLFCKEISELCFERLCPSGFCDPSSASKRLS